MLPVLLALWIGATRVHDNKHHPADVVAGALLGMFFPVFAARACLPGVSPLVVPVSHSAILSQVGSRTRQVGSKARGGGNPTPWYLC